MTHEELILAGYFPKDTRVPEGWTGPAHVTGICSVSDCVASSPPDWIEHWLHNDWGLFNSPADAQSVVPPGSSQYALFAYRLLPLRFVDGRSERLAIPELTVVPPGPDFLPLGFDAVSRLYSAFFECSPLSCNGLADEVEVNRFCLVDGLERAAALAERFSREQPEPGAYYVLEVLGRFAGEIQ